MTDQAPEATQQSSQQHLSQWEFLEVPPTTEDVLRLLGTLPPVWGISPLEYAEYVQPLPSRKKYFTAHPDRPNVQLENYVDVWTLYMSVAGRQAMLNAAQAQNDWRVDFTPEQMVPGGAAGFLADQPRIVYREYIEIWAHLPQNLEMPTQVVEGPNGMKTYPGIQHYLGKRSGQAAVPFAGGTGAAGTNPIEKVETSARGRALGAWGFGVFPGSGIASLEEMLAIAQNQPGPVEPESGRPLRGTGQKKGREELLEDVMTASEDLRQLMGASEDDATKNLGKYLSAQLGASKAYDADTNEIDWSAVKDGQLVMALGKLDERRRQWSTEAGL